MTSVHLRVCPYMTRLAVTVAVHRGTAIMIPVEIFKSKFWSCPLPLPTLRLSLACRVLISSAYLLISRDALRNLSNAVRATSHEFFLLRPQTVEDFAGFTGPALMIPMRITPYQSPRCAMPDPLVVSRWLFALPSPATIQTGPYLSGSAYKGAPNGQVPCFAHD